MTGDFKVSVVKISDVSKHPNADRLEVATVLGGWQCVVRKGQFREGDIAVYIPIDSILPVDVEGKIFGPNSKVKLNKHRVRTIKLRGQISQGLLVPCGTLGVPEVVDGSDLCEQLGITKYEPPPPPPKFSGVMGRTNKTKKGNTNFKVYTKWPNVKNTINLFAPDEMLVVTEKIHGCLRADTAITLFDGSKLTIKDIVDNKLDVDLLGFDDNNKPVPVKITNHYNNGIHDKWNRLKLSKPSGVKGNSYSVVNCTPNHKFYNHTKREYMACEHLKVGDKVSSAVIHIAPNKNQEEVLLGKMLGDGSLCNGSVEFGHKKEHEEYVDYTLECLGELAGNKQKEQTSGYGTAMCKARSKSTYAISQMFDPFVTSGKKEVPKVKLSPIAIAFWYMDDGSISHTEKQKDRASFATCGFNEQSVDNLCAAFLELGIKATKQYSSGYYRIRLNTDEAYKMFDMIYKYVPECMRYKLPEEYRNKEFTGVELLPQQTTIVVEEQTVLANEQVTDLSKVNKTRYDLETTTHNFVANGFIVHNSNFRAGWVPTEAKTFFDKIKKFFGLLPEYEFVYGSHNVQLSDKATANVYARTVEQYNLKEMIPKGYVVYGEIYGDGIQKGYSYGLVGETRLILFDISHEGRYLNYYDFKDVANFIGIRTVPLLKMKRVNGLNIDTLCSGKSVLHQDTIREGCVVKTFEGTKGVKCINPAYLLKDQTDYH